MARIRTIKPDFWTDEKLAECSPSARLLFVGMLNFSDDYGNLPRSSKKLKMQIFPSDSIDCEKLVLEIFKNGLAREYETNGDKFIHIKGFLKHQKIDKPTKSNIPSPKFDDNSPNDRREDVEPSPMEGNGMEGSGMEDTSEAKASSVTHTRTKKSELPNNFYPDAAGRDLCAKLEIELVEAVLDMQDWCASKRPRYYDWQAVFRNLVKRMAKDRQKFGGQKNGTKSTTGWIAEGDRLAAKYAAEAELERQQQANSQPSPEPGLCLAAPVREDLGRA